MHTLVQQVVWDLLRKNVSRETLETHTAKFFDTDAEANKLVNNLITSHALLGPMATLVKRKTSAAIEEEKPEIALASKNDQIKATETFDGPVELPSSCSGSGSAD